LPLLYFAVFKSIKKGTDTLRIREKNKEDQITTAKCRLTRK
jgi:hypothetical protein